MSVVPGRDNPSPGCAFEYLNLAVVAPHNRCPERVDTVEKASDEIVEAPRFGF
jgi:hypothetical protein